MSRDFKKLEMFQMADSLVLDVYRATRAFPAEERYALQAQLRRASLSVPCNIVEGSTRLSERDCAHFLRIACGSASEARYLISVAVRLEFLPSDTGAELEHQFDRVVRGLEVLAQRVEGSTKRRARLPTTRREP